MVNVLKSITAYIFIFGLMLYVNSYRLVLWTLGLPDRPL